MMAKTPEFKAPQDVRVKQPESAGLFGEEVVKVEKDSRETNPTESVSVVSSPTQDSVSIVADGELAWPAEIEWQDIPNFVYEDEPRFPYNGEPVWLTPDGSTEYLAVWRVTREFREGRFQPIGFWAIRNGGGTRIPFDPLGYRKFEEPIYTPRKRA